MVSAGHDRLVHTAGNHQHCLPGRGRDSVPVGGSTFTVPAVIHSLLRQRLVVSPRCQCSDHVRARGGFVLVIDVRKQ